jgi:hypothetical protein
MKRQHWSDAELVLWLCAACAFAWALDFAGRKSIALAMGCFALSFVFMGLALGCYFLGWGAKRL